MYEEKINYPEITEFLNNNLSPLIGDAAVLEKELREKESLPIVRPSAARFLQFLCLTLKPRKILEIGTCVGFSAILMKNACPEATITTIDRYDYMINRAKENFSRFDKEGKITLLEGQASEILPTLKEEYDFIFLDAAKGQYPAFLPLLLERLAPGGVLLVDDVLFDGLVAESSRSSRRDMTIVKRLRSFITEINENKDLYSSLTPIGDGMLLITKKGEN